MTSAAGLASQIRSSSSPIAGARNFPTMRTFSVG